MTGIFPQSTLLRLNCVVDLVSPLSPRKTSHVFVQICTNCTGGTGGDYSITSLKVKLHAGLSSLFCGLSGRTCRGGEMKPRYCLLDLVSFLSSLVKEMPFLLSSRAA